MRLELCILIEILGLKIYAKQMSQTPNFKNTKSHLPAFHAISSPRKKERKKVFMLLIAPTFSKHQVSFQNPLIFTVAINIPGGSLSFMKEVSRIRQILRSGVRVALGVNF